MSDNKFTCGLCSVVWKKSGSTNCWSADPSKGPARPAYCPTHGHSDLIKEAKLLPEAKVVILHAHDGYR